MPPFAAALDAFSEGAKAGGSTFDLTMASSDAPSCHCASVPEQPSRPGQ